MLHTEGLPTSYRFRFGLSKRYTGRTSIKLAGAGASPTAVWAKLPRLKPDTIYHYRLVAISAAGATLGADRTFRTPPLPGKTHRRRHAAGPRFTGKRPATLR
jgi:hypothetical protein